MFAAGHERCGGAIGLVYMALSAVCFSVMSLLINVLGHGTGNLEKIPSFELASFRAIVGLFVCYTWVTKFAKPEHGVLGPRGKRKLLFSRGAVGIVGMLCNWTVLSQMPLGEATVIVFTAPLFTCIFGSLFLGEPFGPIEIFAAVLSFAGVILVARPKFIFGIIHMYDDCGQEVPAEHVESKLPRSVLIGIGILGAVASAFTNIIVRKLLDVNAIVTVGYLMAVAVVMAPLGSFLLQDPVLPSSITSWFAILGICILGFAGQAFKTQGLKWENAGVGSLMRNLDLVFAFSFQVLLLRQKPPVLSVVGAMLTILGTFFLGSKKIWSSSKDKTKSEYELVAAVTPSLHRALSTASNGGVVVFEQTALISSAQRDA